MSQINTQNLLRLGNVPDEPGIAIPPVEFNQSSFQGGQVQVGAPRQQVGPSSEQAMYGALAEIAGGVKSGISIFSEIVGNEEKSRIEKAKLEFKKIFSGEYVEKKTEDGKIVKQYLSPEEKIQEWDTYVKDISTPLLGDTWKQDLNIDAYSSFGSREASEKFEAERYQREMISYFKSKGMDASISQDPEEMVMFDQYYADKFKSASGNAWFQAKTIQNKDLLKQDQQQDALRILPYSVSKLINIPSEPELQEVANNGPDAESIKANYPIFFDLVSKQGSASIDQIQNSIQALLVDELVTKNPSKYEPHVLIPLKDAIDTTSLDLGKTVWQAAGNIRRMQRNVDAQQEIHATNIELEAKPFDKTVRKRFIASTINGIGILGQPVAKNQTDVQDAIERIYDNMNKPGETPSGDEFVNWKNLSAKEKINLIVSEFEETIQPGSREEASLTRALGFKDPNQAREYVRNTAKNNVYSSKIVQEDQDKRVTESLEGVDVNITSIQMLGTAQAVQDRVNAAIDSLASSVGLTVGELRAVYIEVNKEQNFTDITTNFDKSFDNWIRTTGKNFTSLEINQIRKLALASIKIEQAAINHVNSPGFKKRQETEEPIDLTKYKKPNEQFSAKAIPDTNETNGRISTTLLTGRAFEETSNKDYLEFLAQMYEDSLVIEEIPTDIQPNQLTARQRQALQRREDFETIAKQDPDFARKTIEQLIDIHDLSNRARLIVPELVLAHQNIDQLSTGDQAELTAKYNQYASDFVRKTVSGKIKPFTGIAPTGQAYTPNGELTLESIEYLLHAKLTTERLLSGTSKDIATWGASMKQVTDALGSQANIEEALQNPENILPVLGFHFMAREFGRLRSSNGVVAGTNFFLQTLALSASGMERISIPELINFWTKPETRELSSLVAALPLLVAKRMQVGSTNSRFYMVTGGDNQLFPAMERTVEDYRARKVNSSLVQLSPQASQDEKDRMAKGEQIDPVTYKYAITPYSPEWNSTSFIDSLKASGVVEEEASEAVVASFIRASILGDSLDEAYSDPNAMLSDAQIIRLGAQVLYQANLNMPNALQYATEYYLDPALGINSKYFEKAKSRSKAEAFFNYVGSLLDISAYSHRGIKNTNYGHIGTAPADGTFVQTSSNRMSSWYAVRNTDRTDSFNPGSMNPFILSSRWFKTSPVDERGIRLPKGYDKFIPDYVENEKQDGLLFKAGSALLDMPFNPDLLKAMIRNWQPLNPENTGGIPSVLNQDKLIATKALNELGQPGFSVGANITMLEALELLDSIYRRLYSELDPNSQAPYPLLNLGSQNRSTPGFSTLRQSIDFRNPKQMLPTWSWSNKGFNGPYIQLTDEVFELARKQQNEYKRRGL